MSSKFLANARKSFDSLVVVSGTQETQRNFFPSFFQTFQRINSFVRFMSCSLIQNLFDLPSRFFCKSISFWRFWSVKDIIPKSSLVIRRIVLSLKLCSLASFRILQLHRIFSLTHFISLSVRADLGLPEFGILSTNLVCLNFEITK